LKQEPEERAKSRGRPSRYCDAHAWGMPQNEIGNIGRFCLGKEEISLLEVLDKKLPNERRVTGDCGCDEPALRA